MVLAVVVVLYPLSSAPIDKFYKSIGRKPPAALATFYGPLNWAIFTFPPLLKAYEFYIKLWGLTD
jgi:hypothetical protein